MSLTVFDLPDEMMIYIFTFLSYETIGQAMLVSQKWMRMGESPVLWANIRLKIEEQKNFFRLAHIPRFSSLKWLSIYSYSENGLNEMMVLITRFQSTLTTLDLKHNKFTSVFPATLCEFLLEYTPRLKYLNLSSTALTKHQAEAILIKIREDGRVKELSMDRNDLSGVDPEILTKALLNVNIVSLSESNLTKHQLEHLLTALDRQKVSLGELNLGQISALAEVSADLFARALSRMEILALFDNQITPNQVDKLFRHLDRVYDSRKEVIRELFISNNHLGELDPALLTRVVLKMKKAALANAGLTREHLSSIMPEVIRGNHDLSFFVIFGNNERIFREEAMIIRDINRGDRVGRGTRKQNMKPIPLSTFG